MTNIAHLKNLAADLKSDGQTETAKDLNQAAQTIETQQFFCGLLIIAVLLLTLILAA